MPDFVQMPQLSDTMTEGTLIRWLVKVGDKVDVGDPLAEVETDKATMEMVAFDEGTIGAFMERGPKSRWRNFSGGGRRRGSRKTGSGEQSSPNDDSDSKESTQEPEPKGVKQTNQHLREF